MAQTSEAFQNRARTKIVATLGPASQSTAAIGALILEGVDVFRLNMAHGSREEHEATLKNIRKVSRKMQTVVGVLVDLAGPKIRLGQLAESPRICREGEVVRFIRGEISTRNDCLVSTYPDLIDELDVGDNVLLADGTVSMEVIESSADEVKARVIGGGPIKHRQGINLPGVRLSVPTLGPKDIENALWAASRDIDLVSLSFVREAEDVRQLTRLLRENGSKARVIAKIEKPEALDDLEAIITASGGAMVARGDLGVEIDVAEIAIAQKRIVATCNRLGRPVIVATQMLDSMTHALRPTRAEATDVANAVLDGADATMLSGETAVGRHPSKAVAMMNRILCKTETLLRDRQGRAPTSTEGVGEVTSAVVYGAGRIADRLGAKLVVIATHTGETALAKSELRDFVPTIAVSDQLLTLQQMSLLWGISPLPGAPVSDNKALRTHIEQWGRKEGLLSSGDRVVFVTGTQIDQGSNNQIIVHDIE